jgi:hypothetical protein
MRISMSLKYLMGFTLVGIMLFAAGRQDGNMVPLAWYLFGLVIVYRVSLWRHPLRNCWKCEGRGRHYGDFFRYARRMCTSCGGNGRSLRFGASRLNIPPTSPR